MGSIEEQIKKLREQGKKLSEISRITGKSIYFIYSRLNPKYKLGQLEITYKTLFSAYRYSYYILVF